MSNEAKPPVRIWVGQPRGTFTGVTRETMVHEHKHFDDDIAYVLATRFERLEQALREIAATPGSDNRCTLSHSWLARAALNDEEKQ